VPKKEAHGAANLTGRVVWSCKSCMLVPICIQLGKQIPQTQGQCRPSTLGKQSYPDSERNRRTLQPAPAFGGAARKRLVASGHRWRRLTSGAGSRLHAVRFT
jgi:hypothetical protein